MKIRKKITIWIAATTIISTISFSLFIVLALVGQHFNLIDKELQYMADAIIKASSNNPATPPIIAQSTLPYNNKHYWINITDSTGILLYKSPMTNYVDITIPVSKTKFSVEKHIPRDQIWLGQDDNDEVLFRVRSIQSSIDLHPVTIIIAVPIEDIEEEYIVLIKEYAIGLILCTLLIICISYILARKILQPVSSINAMAKEISEKSLDKRIPQNKSKDEFYDLSIALNHMFDRLQNSFTRQKEFIGNASHELKSPITLLKLAQEELLMNYDLSLPVKNNLERQLKTTLRMSRLVRNLLDLSRLEQLQTISPAPVDLGKLLNKVMDDYSDLLATTDITVNCNLAKDMVLEGDHEKLSRLLINLIDNSIRYNLKQAGIIHIRGVKKDGRLTLTLANTGQPIPQKERELVFEQFYRVEKSRATTHGGTGLGLTIAREIIELHAGIIQITTDADHLTNVTITLPLTQTNCQTHR